MCVRHIEFTYLYDFSVECWNCSDIFPFYYRFYLGQEKCTLEWNSVAMKYRERDVQVWINVKVYFKWGWNKSPFDSVVFHFDEFNYAFYCFN
jgi:hypothetical protein